MRMVTIDKFVITKDQLAKALDVEKVDSIVYKDSFFKIIIHKRIKVVMIYLRCDDIKKLLGLDFNIFDEDVRIDKKGNILYFREVEQLKSSFDEKKLKWCIKKVLE